MNATIKVIVKTKFQKILDVGFIYPIFDSQWVSPLVVVPNKNGKWWIYVDYRELINIQGNATFHFPSQTKSQTRYLARNIYPSYKVSMDTTRSKFIMMIKIKPHLLVHGAHLFTNLFLLSYAIPQLLFKGKSWVYSLILFITKWKSRCMNLNPMGKYFTKPLPTEIRP